MADPELYIKQQRLGPRIPPNQPNPSKFYTQFMYKAVIVAVFLVILPFFPSQAPDFINHSRHTRSWELVQLLLVGIAVSYGLFSRKNREIEKEHSPTLDYVQSYVSRLLQVSSVSDDDSESPSMSDANKVQQTWSSQYFRGDPVVVVAQENSLSDHEKRSGSASRVIVDKPLLLPIRSLKSRPDFPGTANESSGIGGSSPSKSSSNSGSKRVPSNSNKIRNGEVGGSIPLNMELKNEECVVLRSPIPWRSRSGRMEMKEETDDNGVPQYSLPPSNEESDFKRPRSQFNPNPVSISSSKNTYSTLSSDSQPDSFEEVPRKKIYYKSSPPPAPPPPPPPPPYMRKPPLVRYNSTSEVYPARELKRSAWSIPELINDTEAGEMQNRANSGAELRPRFSSDGSLTRKLDRTIKLGEPTQEDIPKTGFPYYKREEKQEFEEDVAVGTDEESESEDEDVFERGSENESGNENENENKEVVSNDVGDVGKDVDKKADEFIAKFREQIRLQRIESIKRSTGVIAKNSHG